MKPEQLIEKLYSRLSKRDLSRAEGKLAIQIDLTGKVSGVLYVEILNGVLSVMPYEYIDRDAKISIAITNLEKILNGKLDMQVAMAQGKMKVEGNIDKVFLLEQLLK